VAAVVAHRALKQDEANRDLLQEVLNSDNLWRAWRRVKSNKGKPGIDGVTVEEWPAHARLHWQDVRAEIEQGRYKPQAVKRVEIPKRGGGKRPLGIPTVTDRVIQQAIAQVLTPIFDPGFSDWSYGFRPGRNAHQAIRQVQEKVKQGWRWAVDIDLAKFFDTVNHDLLMHLLGRAIADKALLKLIGRYLRAGVLVDEHLEPSEVGTPQGGPLSPLLANIVLHQLDLELERRGHHFARYADDMIILVKSRRAGDRVMASLTRFLEERLKLKVNTAKSKVAPVSECDFLSFRMKGTKIRWSDQALADFKQRVKKLTGRSWRVSMKHRLDELGRYLRGWVGYFGISQYYRPVPRIDEWIRRRIRMCYWKQWRSLKTRIRKLMRLGVKRDDAIAHGLSSHNYFRMSRSPVVQQALSNAWLRSQGLVSVKDLWCKAQGFT
jgi:RNA-directed DNA polymerase